MFKEKRMKRFWLIASAHFVCLSILSPVNCNADCEPNPSSHPLELVVAQGATDVSFMKCRGVDQLSYHMEKDYPASDVIKEISQNLEKQGWQPLKQDFLNPAQPSSHVKGWDKFVDSTKGTQRMVYSWLGQWKNGQDDVVWYSFRYTLPVSDKTRNAILEGQWKTKLSKLDVIAGYYTAAQVKAVLEARKVDEGVRRQRFKD